MAIIVASANGNVGMEAAIEILRAGGSALDAVEAATRYVELNLDDHSVGVGGYPNLLGQVELDASLMEGTTRRAGAVAALQGYPHPLSVARAVMEHLPQHVLLVGQGAARFAAEQGFAPMNLLTPEVEAIWHEKFPATQTDQSDLVAQSKAAHDPEKTVGTVNFLAQDNAGHIASAVSTSGWAFKYPGRLGDSPIIGAGNYCDDRYGACACTGLGEWAIRAGTARTVILGLQQGLPLEEACRAAMRDLQDIPLPEGLEPVMNLVALARTGHHTAFATYSDRTYLWQTTEMAAYEESQRLTI